MRLIAALIDLYSVIVLVAVVISWIHVNPRHPAAKAVYRLTEPALAPIRRVLPPIAGLDLSPLVLLLALRILRGIW
jgi:YggT family protein